MKLEVEKRMKKRVVVRDRGVQWGPPTAPTAAAEVQIEVRMGVLKEKMEKRNRKGQGQYANWSHFPSYTGRHGDGRQFGQW